MDTRSSSRIPGSASGRAEAAIRSRITRLQILAAAAAVLAAVAVVVNAAHWRRASSRRPAAPAAPVVRWAPEDDRPRQVVALAEHLARHPEDARARLRLAELYFKLKDTSRALAELRVLERDRPRDPEIFLHQAVVLKYAGQPAAAEKAARRALALDPKHVRAREWLGEVALDQERAHDALALFEQCLKRAPDSCFALMGKARALEQLILSRHPIPIPAILQPVERAVALDPENPEALATLARMRFAYQERSEEAEALALRAAALDPGSPRPFIILAQIYLARPPTPESLQKVGEYAYVAGLRDPGDPRPPYFIGRISLQRNDLDRAIKALERSLALGPMPEAVAQLAAACRRAGSGERAAHYAEIYQRYTDLLGRRNALLAAREREPGKARHYYALAELYLEAGQPETAAHWLKEAPRLRGRNPDYDRLLARVRAERGRTADAPLLPIP